MEARSRRPKRREALLRAAAEVFFEQGYAATSIDAIIERAGGSKRNIYSEFGNKEGAVHGHRHRKTRTGGAVVAQSGRDRGRDLRATLTAFGRHLMDVYMSPGVVGIYRIAVTEAKSFPRAGEGVLRTGAGRGRPFALRRFSRPPGSGERSGRMIAKGADHFVGMIRDNLHLQVVLGLRAAPSEEEARAVSSAVEVFLNGVRPRRDM